MTTQPRTPSGPHDPGFDPDDPVTMADPIIQKILRLGQPVTRDNYIGHATTEPENWGAEDEDSMPAFLRR